MRATLDMGFEVIEEAAQWDVDRHESTRIPHKAPMTEAELAVWRRCTAQLLEERKLATHHLMSVEMWCRFIARVEPLAAAGDKKAEREVRELLRHIGIGRRVARFKGPRPTLADVVPFPKPGRAA